MDNRARLPPSAILVYPLRKLRSLCVCGKRFNIGAEHSRQGTDMPLHATSQEPWWGRVKWLPRLLWRVVPPPRFQPAKPAIALSG